MVLLLMLTPAGAAQALEPGEGTITFVDGTETEAEILFEHPNVPRLVVRSLSGAIAQSLPLEEIQQVTVAGETTSYNASRELTEAEQTRRERNGIWGDAASQKRIGRYAEETWEDRPLIVWREPGVSGDLMLAENWLDETGEPLSEPPFVALPEAEQTHGDLGVEGIFDGDVLLPASEQLYEVIQPGVHDPPEIGAYEIRHLTLEAGSIYSHRLIVRGNVWLKDGSEWVAEVTAVLGSGDANKHTFARFCNYYDRPEPHWAYARTIAHLLFLDPGPSGSLEVIGYCGGANDRFTLMRGTLVISENSHLGNGLRAACYADEGTTITLLDGARIGCEKPIKGGSGGRPVATYAIAGTLSFGTPEHPLTRDLPFGAAYILRDEIAAADANPSARAHGASFVFGSTSRVVVHSADPTTARVIFQARSRDLPVSQYTVDGAYRQYIDRRGDIYYPPDPELWEQPGVPTGVAAVFKGETDFNGVVFDDFYEGGIMV
ncbi:MAG: hypothetical protein WD534_12495, partial [Phycisphaeraceae bacterium]